MARQALDRWQLLDNLSTAVIYLDAACAIVELNAAASALLGVGSKARGQCLEDLFLDKDGAGMRAALQRALELGHPFSKREAHVWIGGQERVIDYAVTPLSTAEGGTHLLMELQPMDRLMRIAREEALLTTHQATRQLIRGMAHEIKNPLGGIRGAAQLLARALHDHELEEYTQVIIEEADRLRHLADRMLGSRRPPQPRRVNVHECMERVRALIIAEAAGAVSVERDYDPSLPDIYIDPDQIIQVLLNIAGNALQALVENPQPGKVGQIMLRTRSQRQFTIGTHRHRLVLRLDIEDDGPGIPDAIRAAIFYPMVSGRAAGTGLGLSIAQDLVSQAGGLIECDSRPGQTRFSIYLPWEAPHDGESMDR